MMRFDKRGEPWTDEDIYVYGFFDDIKINLCKRHRNIIWKNNKTGLTVILPYPIDPNNSKCYIIPDENLGIFRIIDTLHRRNYWDQLATAVSRLKDTWTYTFS